MWTDLDVSNNQLAKSVRSDVKLAVLKGTGLVGLISSEDTVLAVVLEHAGLPGCVRGKEAAHGGLCSFPLHYVGHRAFSSDQSDQADYYTELHVLCIACCL